MKKKIISLLGSIMAVALLSGAVSIAAIGEEQSYKATADGYFKSDADISVEYGTTDSRGVLGASVKVSGLAGKAETQISYENYINVNDLKDGFLTLSFEEPTEYGKADFDYLLIEVADAVHADQKLVWAIEINK